MRSILFLPLDKIERVPKALGSNADKVIFDLEDGLAKDKKDFGRENFIEFSKTNFDNQPEKFLLRINGLDSNDYHDDIKMLKGCPNLPYSIAIPKIEDAKECQSFLNDLGKDILVLPQIETPKGIANIEFWDVVGINFSGIGFGSADFTAMTGGDMGVDSLAYSRGKIVNASALYNTIALDGVWLDFRDAEGCFSETKLIKSMGFKGKFAIHPDQIEPIHRAYNPTEEELIWAKGVLKASETAGTGAFNFEGKMVDAPVLARAKSIIEREV